MGMRTPDEQRQAEGLYQRRMRRLGERHRDPGDLVTWASVLGASSGLLLLIAAAYASHGRLGAIAAIAFVVWFAVVTALGNENIISTLMGGSPGERKHRVNVPAVIVPTLALTLLTVGSYIWAWFADVSLGWPGILAAIAASAFLFIYIASLTRSDRSSS